MGSFPFSVQVTLISAGVLLLALVLKVSVPFILDFSIYKAPLIWSSLASWLKPPYIYFIINCIIITIAASSRFHKNNKQQQDYHQQGQNVTPPQLEYEMKISTAEIVRSDFDHTESTVEIEASSDVVEDKSVVAEVRDEGDEELVISRSEWVPPRRMDLSSEMLLPAEKPLVSSRFGHRKPLKSGLEGGRALRVSKPKKQETLDNTWKMITEGRSMPLTRHLQKSDTWERVSHGRQANVSQVDQSTVKKSETFKDRTNYQLPPVSHSPSPNKLRKEPSLSQDELNRRAEAFIKKFNEEMRLQRQESLNQYKEMISRGSH